MDDWTKIIKSNPGYFFSIKSMKNTRKRVFLVNKKTQSDQSKNGKKVVVLKSGAKKTSTTRGNQANKPQNAPPKPNNPSPKKYSIHNKPVQATNKTKNTFFKSIDTLPRHNPRKDYLNRTIKLEEEIASGGEGTIYTTNRSGTVAKVFPRDYRKQVCKKIEFLASINLSDIPRLTLPNSIIYDTQGAFIGYTMPYHQKNFSKLNIIKTPARKSFFSSDITYSFLLDICIQIANVVDQLHKRSIIIADMKPDNIMINRQGQVFFIDIDSFQLSQKYKCNRLTVPYTPPELLSNKGLTSQLRFWSYDIFSLLVIVFEILTLGSHPYDRLYGGTLVENMKNGYYEYPHPQDNSPFLKYTRADVYDIIKQNFSMKLQTLFFHHFHAHGKSRSEKNRYKAYMIKNMLIGERKGQNK